MATLRFELQESRLEFDCQGFNIYLWKVLNLVLHRIPSA